MRRLSSGGGEFGRQPTAEYASGSGRDHNSNGFTMWMAGGGIKKGAVHGQTDAIGYKAVEGSVSTHDINATILHLLGFDHEQFTYDFQGRPFRLTDIAGNVINEILS